MGIIVAYLGNTATSGLTHTAWATAKYFGPDYIGVAVTYCLDNLGAA